MWDSRILPSHFYHSYNFYENINFIETYPISYLIIWITCIIWPHLMVTFLYQLGKRKFSVIIKQFEISSVSCPNFTLNFYDFWGFDVCVLNVSWHLNSARHNKYDLLFCNAFTSTTRLISTPDLETRPTITLIIIIILWLKTIPLAKHAF